jgi:hypothetical protein
MAYLSELKLVRCIEFEGVLGCRHATDGPRCKTERHFALVAIYNGEYEPIIPASGILRIGYDIKDFNTSVARESLEISIRVPILTSCKYVATCAGYSEGVSAIILPQIQACIDLFNSTNSDKGWMSSIFNLVGK